MSGLIVYDTASSVFEMLWDIAVAYFVVRLGLIYAAVAGASAAAATYLLTWAMQYHVLLPPGTLQPSALSVAVSAAQLAAAVACALWVVSRYEIPKDWRLRAGIGIVGAAVLAAAGSLLEMLTAGGVAKDGMALVVGGKGLMALCIALLPIALMVFEPRTPPYARRDSWLPVGGNDKASY